MPAIFWDVFSLSFLGNSSIRPKLVSTDQARGQGETLYQQCFKERNPREYCLNTSQSCLSTAFTDTCTHSSSKSKACIFSNSTKDYGKCGTRGRMFFCFFFKTGLILHCLNAWRVTELADCFKDTNSLYSCLSLSMSLSPVWRCVSDSPRGLWDMYGLSCLEQRSSLVTQRHSLTCDTRWQTSTLLKPRER